MLPSEKDSLTDSLTDSLLRQCLGRTITIPNLFEIAPGWVGRVNPINEGLKEAIDDWNKKYQLTRTWNSMHGLTETDEDGLMTPGG